MKAAKLGWAGPGAGQEQTMSRPGAGWEQAKSRSEVMQEQGMSKSRARAVHLPNFIQIIRKTEKLKRYWSALIGSSSQSEKQLWLFQTHSMFFLAPY